MVDRPSVLCPVDFSEPSRGAVRYAVALAEHFYGVLTVATVDDPLLRSGSDVAFGDGWLKRESSERLEAFLAEAIGGRRPEVAELNLDVVTGKPAPQIIRLASLRHADALVISTHGLSGVNKWFFGSTAERILRETTVPVLVTPPDAVGPDTVEAARQSIRTVVVPIDLSDASSHQVRVASGLASALGARLVATHVAEPFFGLAGHEAVVARFRFERRLHAEQTLKDLIGGVPPTVHATLVTANGNPAEEISRLAERCDADLIVMGLHASIGAGPRMGSVTYRVLCKTRTLVLALPPQHDGRADKPLTAARAEEIVATR